MGDIGKKQKEVELEPMEWPDEMPSEPSPVVEPERVPAEPERVPVGARAFDLDATLWTNADWFGQES